MKYTNGTITKSYRELCVHFNASLPRNNPENWPEGPWTMVLQESPALTIEQRREIKRIELKQRRIEIVSAPINNIQVATVEDRDNIEWAAANATMPVHWIMADNTVQMLGADDFAAVIAEYPARKQAAFSVYADLRQQLQNSTEPELIEWPSS